MWAIIAFGTLANGWVLFYLQNKILGMEISMKNYLKVYLIHTLMFHSSIIFY